MALCHDAKTVGTEIISSIFESHSYMGTINNNLPLCGDDYKPCMYILLNSTCNPSLISPWLNAPKVPDTRGRGEASYLCKFYKTHGHMDILLGLFPSLGRGLCKWGTTKQTLSASENICCKVAKVKMGWRDPAWKHRNLSGAVTQGGSLRMKTKAYLMFISLSFLIKKVFIEV